MSHFFFSNSQHNYFNSTFKRMTNCTILYNVHIGSGTVELQGCRNGFAKGGRFIFDFIKNMVGVLIYFLTYSVDLKAVSLPSLPP